MVELIRADPDYDLDELTYVKMSSEFKPTDGKSVLDPFAWSFQVD